MICPDWRSLEIFNHSVSMNRNLCVYAVLYVLVFLLSRILSVAADAVSLQDETPNKEYARVRS